MKVLFLFGVLSILGAMVMIAGTVTQFFSASSPLTPVAAAIVDKMPTNAAAPAAVDDGGPVGPRLLASAPASGSALDEAAAILGPAFDPPAVPRKESTAEERELLKKEEEEYFQFKISRDPTPDRYFDYAEFLFNEDRLAEARHQLGACLRSSVCKPKGQILLDGIEKIATLSDSLDLSMVRLDVMNKLSELYRANDKAPDEATKELEADLAKAEATPPAALVAPVAAMGYAPSETEEGRLRIVHYYEADAELERAAHGYARLVNEYPSSPYMQVEYVRFLTRIGNLDEARAYMAQTEQRYPAFQDEPEWMILSKAFLRPPATSEELDSSLSDLLSRQRGATMNSMYLEPIFPLNEVAIARGRNLERP